MTNIQKFDAKHNSLCKDAWCAEFVSEFGCEYAWAVLKYNQLHGA